jgi:NAD(P)-dependent dehydrogenase (short-subunit alcohol dehydrogenase family)
MLNGKDRVVMLTGASRGIGKALATRLLEDGFTISAGVRNPNAFEGDSRIAYFPYDAENPADASRWLEDTLQRFGRLQALVNVAGISRRFAFSETDDAGLDEMWRVNVKAPLRLIALALPHLKACGEGRIVNVVSVAGKNVRAASAVGYAATKHAMMAVTKATRREAWADGVRATAICPGFVATDMTKNNETVARDQMTRPEDVAELIRTVLLMPNTAGIPECVIDCLDNW